MTLLFIIAYGVIVAIAVLGLIASGFIYRKAVQCYVCKGTGQYAPDPEFECEECGGTGLLIFECYSNKESTCLQTEWIKTLWFRWTVRE